MSNEMYAYSIKSLCDVSVKMTLEFVIYSQSIDLNNILSGS